MEQRRPRRERPVPKRRSAGEEWCRRQSGAGRSGDGQHRQPGITGDQQGREEKSLYAQRDNLTRAYNDLSAKVGDKLRAEQDADRALADGAKKDPPPSASDLQSLEKASAAARQERENTEAERSNFWLQIVTPADQAYWAKVSESIPLKKQLSGLKQQRDTLMLGLNKARTALAELNQEYQEPSL